MPYFTNLNYNGLRRLERIAKREAKYINGDLVYNLFTNFEQESITMPQEPRTMVEQFFYAQEVIHSLYNNTINQINEFILSTIHNEAYHFNDMLKQPDRIEFVKAIKKEIDVYQRRNHWELCKKSDVLKGTKTIISIWVFKRKRLPSGELLKYKARLCAHSRQQQWGVNY